jgi:hypothetical protein
MALGQSTEKVGFLSNPIKIVSELSIRLKLC